MAENQKRVVGVISGKKLKQTLKSKKGLALIAVAAVACLLFFSASGSGSAETAPSPAEVFDSEAYVRALEERLENVISSISGAGKTEVMLTLGSGEEYCYQSDVKESADSGSAYSAELNTVVVKASDGSEKAVIKSSLSPIVTGVVVVCRGGGSGEVRESIFNAVKALLGLPANRICVLKMS